MEQQAERDAPAAQAAIEVTMNELDRRAARVVREVIRGRPAVVTRYGKAVAMIIPLAEAESLRPAAVPTEAVSELRAQLAEREERRWWSRILHGRWLNGGGIHGPYR